LRETQAQIQKLIALEQQLEYSLSTLDPCSRCDTSAEEHHCHGCLQETLANQQNTDLPAVLIPVVQRVLQDTQESGIQ
jgi:recombinational DNA repair protein RecR